MRNIAALFSILMPGFGQIYNGQFIKGVFFIIVEHFDNAFGHINEAIHENIRWKPTALAVGGRRGLYF
ncbi:hypothetical protein [Parageobacillus toebii]|uniref:hypothetical protein n=1 Tax=Parageobacillus toebii TaxID=153151 RepID=UPI000788CF52|nr:hypothetical protein [Parageobacillus toebii]